jgi:hypothetical protein
MLERAAKLLVVILTIVTLFDGCAYFSKNGRQQMAYERYIRKCSNNRSRLQAKMKTKAPRIPKYEPSEPKETTQLGGSPESVTSGQSRPAQDNSQAAPVDSAPPPESP